MMATVKRVKAVKEFIGTTYAVWCDGRCVKIFSDKKDAERFASELNDK